MNLRALRRNKSFTGLATITLALGLGATVTIFGVANGVLFEALPYPDSKAIVKLDHSSVGLGVEEIGMSGTLYLHYRENSKTLQEVGLYDDSYATLTGSGDPQRVRSAQVSPSLFRVLDVRPVNGRTFSADEGEPGAPRLAVISSSLWRDRYASDPGLVGKTLEVDGLPTEVIGVMPEDFHFPNRETVLWLQRIVDPATERMGAFVDNAIARRASDATLEQVQTELGRLSSNLEASFPGSDVAPLLDRSEFRATAEPLLEATVGDLRAVFWILLGTVGIILLITCANIANLFLVRVEERSHELSLRAALGATRPRLIRQLLRESLSMAVIGGALGLAFATVSLRLIRAFGPDSLPRLDEISVGPRVVLFTVIASIISGIAFGLAPALRGTAQRILQTLGDGGRRATAGRGRHLLRHTLVVTQIALGVVLLVGSGLLTRSLLQLRQVDPGFTVGQAITFRVTLPEADYPEAEQRAAFVDRALERFSGLPGVESAGMASYLPLAGMGNGSGFVLEDFAPQANQPPPIFMRTHASTTYLETIGARLIEGRLLEAGDSRNHTGNIVISRSIADRFWPGGSALGKRMKTGRDPDLPWQTVVGVIENLKHERLDEEPVAMAYLPLLVVTEGEDVGSQLSFLVRTTVEPSSVVSSLRAEISQLDARVPMTQVRTMEQIVAESRAQVSFTVLILMLAAALSLVLAAVGLYSVVSYITAGRTRELGVRLALGAQRRDVGRLVLGSAIRTSVLGVVLGTALAASLSRLLEAQLFQIDRLDPVTFSLAPALLVGIALVATLAPALRATRIDPAEALRSE